MMNNPMNHISQTYYGSWMALLEKIQKKLNLCTQVFQIFLVLKDAGLRPGYMLQSLHPAYFTDEIARYCLATYDSQEPENWALERCITQILHERIEAMKLVDLSKVKMDGRIWEQFLSDDLLRLIWREMGGKIAVTCYLNKDSQTQLSDRFLVEAEGGYIRLTQCTHQRTYELDARQWDFDTFCQRMQRGFQLSTEDYGYFMPKFVWMSHRQITEDNR